MFDYVQGTITTLTPAQAIIEAGGVGYALSISLNTFTKLTSTKAGKIYIEQTYVRDDLPRTFGFADVEERKLFRLLISVSGVGGNSALVLLSSLTANEIYEGITTGNAAMFKKVKGIGEKTSQRIIVDLKDKIGKAELSTTVFTTVHNTIKDQALSALLTLGFNRNIAEKEIDKLIKNATTENTIEDLIKMALKNL
jgi:holliday junction DNA helicase RuvA